MSTDQIPAAPLLETRGLAVHFTTRRRLGRAPAVVRAVDGVDLAVWSGRTLGLVGESGCGKTTLGLTLLRAHDPVAGEILYRRRDGQVTDLAKLGHRELRAVRKDLRMVFQDPYSSLNPRLTLLEIVGEPLKVNKEAAGGELEDRVAEVLRRVGLRPEFMRRYPHAFSGGERQRVSIARALVLRPRLVVADEAVSALDVSIRAQILNLLADLQEELGLTYLFISHDLAVVEYVCDRVAVMYLGKVVELAGTGDLYAGPLHPYTEALLSSVPKPDPRLRDPARRIVLSGDVPDPAAPPPGCSFHTRCRYATERCAQEVPALRELRPGHLAACHHAEALSLKGVS